ncbi:MAG TPA: hypothetical protein PKW08_02805 [Flavobacteriaceae bacterium]|nr:hypothetical protein [Flavobacteriaceae bacterium]MCB9212190.1 hypothetical protein [Alteromonas sp.]HPF10432.1 hypothetical protein [Flavobacteriaceae bacterium]HQU20496.1 hypothetical protein [Flavobacteriaceae bacterium]HQU64643.1 hypothetical protein [Flavobacteriaceae bacterium]
MKRNLLIFTLAITSMILVVSCSKDDGPNNPQATCSDGIKNGDETGVDCGGSACAPCATNQLAGEITEDTSLDASVAYELNGALVVKAGASLTIPGGTVIKATGGTSAYIAVEKGAQIFVNGNANAPVVMTSASANPAAGDWGGLVICGDAPTNKGVNVTSEVADLSYGGNNPNDSSGSIKYLRVEYTGATFSNDKEFNGVSLFGVGAGTTFEFVQSFNGGDDGIEFFGGSVNGNNLVSVGSGDDSIDFADGWTGTGTNWYILGGAKAGIEGSNNGEDGNATPVTTTTLNNITVIGPVTEGALFFKEGGGNFTINNFYTSNVDLGVKVTASDNAAAARIEAGALQINNIQFANAPSGLVITDYEGDNQSFFTEGVNSGAGNGAASPDWAAGWTIGLDNSGAATTENLAGEVTGTVTLDPNVEYQLTSSFVVLNGGVLNIPAGTTIKATGGTAAYIAVAQGGKIFINGEANNPVVMTSAAASPAAGDWGGLVLCGKAPTNKGINVTSEVADLNYGGTDPNDNSGSIKYLRVEYTGATFSNDKEFNGVSLFGVGAGTVFEYVQSLNGGDDGIEFFGGSVSGNYLVSIGSGDDSIDFADGWTGTGSNWYIKGGAKAGIEGSNNGDDGNATPVTTTTLSNITVVGPVTEGALFFKEGGGNFTITNFYTNNVDLGVKVTSTDAAAAARIEADALSINPMQFDNPAAGFMISDYGGANQDFVVEGPTSGAGNGAAAPSWASGWTSGL